MTDVYLDAVLRPNLTPLTLAQEGWHHDVAIPEGDEVPASVAYKGVVYNEMKGVYSSPEARLHHAQQAALFPGTEYAHNSGGSPEAIPSLTWEQFEHFHKQCYHPSNAKAFFYGDDPETARLEKLHEHFSKFEASTPVPPPAVQAKLAAPSVVYMEYPAESEDSHSDDFVSIGWVLDSGRREEGVPAAAGGGLPVDPATGHADMSSYNSLRMHLVSDLLLGDRTSILHKALVDSGLGSAVTGGGYESSIRQGMFTVGLKGVSQQFLDDAGAPASAQSLEGCPEHAYATAGVTPAAEAQRRRAVAAVLDAVMQSLHSVVEHGFEKERVCSMLNSLEFRVREFAATGGSHSKGLSLFLGLAGEWNAGHDPMSSLMWEEPLERLKAELSSPEQAEHGYPALRFMVQQLLIENTHRVAVHAAPSASLVQAETKAEAAAAAAHLTAKGPSAPQEAVALAAELTAKQAKPDDPALVAKIPTLNRSDMEQKARWIPQQVSPLVFGTPQGVNAGGGAPDVRGELLAHEQATAGIAYTSTWLDASGVSSALLPLLPLFCSLSTNTGLGKGAATGAATDVQLAHRIGTASGGIGLSSVLQTVPGTQGQQVHARVSVRGKALRDKCGELGDLVTDVALHAELGNYSIAIDLLKESIAEKMASVPQSGHQYAARFLGAADSHEGAVGEVWGGLTSLHWQKALLGALEGKPVPTRNVVHRAVSGLGEGVPCIQLALELPAVPCRYLSAASTAQARDMFVEDLLALRCSLMQQQNATGVVTADAATLGAASSVVSSLAHALPRGPAVAHGSSSNSNSGTFGASPSSLWGMARPETHSMQLLTAASSVNYVVQKLPLQSLVNGDKLLPGWTDVVSSWLGTSFLWNTIRVQGGAYGAFMGTNQVHGSAAFASYRDPKLAATLQAYGDCGQWLASGKHLPTQKEVDNAIISTIGSLDSPMTPEAMGSLAARRRALGVSMEDVQQRRDEILGTTPAHFKQFGEALVEGAASARAAAITSVDAAQKDEEALQTLGYTVATRPAL